MIMYLPFGDWSDDGHGKYINVLIEAPAMYLLRDAQEKIRAEYGRTFFNDMANGYEKPCFTDRVWQALIDTKYPIDRFIEKETVNSWLGVNSLEEVLEIDENLHLSLDFVVDAFIWLLNCFGARIILLKDPPTICNWSCEGFETVGYGCF